MDLFLTEDDYLPEGFDELPLDEAILRVREMEDERPSTSKQKRSKDGKVKRKRPRDDDEEGDDRSDRSDPADDQYSDDDDGWLVNDLGDDGYGEEDEDDDKNVVTVKDGVKIFGEDEAEEEEDGEGKRKKDMKAKEDDKEKEKKPRRRVKTGPRVMLNVDRLKDIRALAALPDIQKKLHFKGKGHEEEDLSLIMETMEHWAHRLMPKMKFDDFIKKTEQLGRKKAIKVFVHNIRHDLPLNTINKSGAANDDFDIFGMDSGDDFKFDDDLPPMSNLNAEDAFDAIMREAEEVVKQRAAAAASAENANSPSTSGIQSTTNGSLDNSVTPIRSSNTEATSSQSTTPAAAKTPSALTEEQRRRIAENARKAAEKRLSLQMSRSQPIPSSQENAEAS